MQKNEIHDIKRTINKIARDKGRFPHIQEMCDALKFSKGQVYNYMNALADDGYIDRIGDWFEYPKDKIEIVDDTIKYTEMPKEEIQEKIEKAYDSLTKSGIISEKKRGRPVGYKVKKKEEPKKESDVSMLAVYVIKWAMLVVGIGSIIISIYYNTKMAMEFLPWFLAMIAGAIFVLFSVVSFEAILLFMSYKKVEMWKRFCIVSGLGALWVVVALFSVTATVSGRYERFMVNQQHTSADNRGISVGRMKWNNIQDRKKNIEKIIANKQDRIKKLNRISSSIDDIQTRENHGKTFADTEWRISLLERDIDKYNKDLEKIRDEETKHLELNPESTSADEYAGNYDDFNKWLGSIFGVPKEKVHFFLALLPAFFFDIVSPVSVGFFLFLRKI